MLSRNLALFFEINLLTRSFMVFLAIFVEICKKSSQTSESICCYAFVLRPYCISFDLNGSPDYYTVRAPSF